MPIFLPASMNPMSGGDNLTPRQIVTELDTYVVGQAAAKRAVAIALRNRIRRQRLPAEIAEEVTPKNILMIGPTGVGKTEIARRLARLSGSPFLKVEASKYTEVGYVGRDVESMIRDLTETGVDMVRRERRHEMREQAQKNVEERLLDLLLPPPRVTPPAAAEESAAAETTGAESFRATREKLRDQLRHSRLEEREVEVELRERGTQAVQILTAHGTEEMDLNLKDLMPGLFGPKTRRRTLTVAEARAQLLEEEQDRLVDMEQVARLAIERVQSSGIVFIDEIDKIAARERGQGPDVSREGVQRDLLPIVEGTTVTTKHGQVHTDHILFIAAGAFHVSKPSDLIPELQGRFPIRVTLDALGLADLVRILTEPKSALIRQYQALMDTEGIALEFTPDAIQEIAKIAVQVNDNTENIGARRLATILEAVLEEISFEGGDGTHRAHRIDADDVRRKLAHLLANQDLSRFIL
ncbi:MAG: ATP-dependent protease ATPase subunit HslU [Vicinamibacteria bacterium]|jgi:ATP-dependent HslUV protease ATP-binding subunit HslU|nr:ATP-dependent protease ATPase subunit HslU [Vicinamibacteria bacterium]